MIRNPELGKVKTRLARTTGDAEALRIYQFLLERTRISSQEVEARRMLWYSNFVAEQDEWLPEYFEKYVQEGNDLGARMRHTFQTAFDSGATKALIIGSDCPQLSGQILEQAFLALDRDDFVIGPVPDGGYYLLGMKQLAPSLFEGIEWSTETVRAVTLEKIQKLGETCFLLPELSDIDTEADYESYKKLVNK